MAETLKSHFGTQVVRRLAADFARVSRDFDARRFTREASAGLENLELMERGRHLARVLQRHLPSDYERAIDRILATLPAERSPDGGMASFFYLPHTEFVRLFGVAHFEPSMRALHALTQCFTGEFAIRPFLEHERVRTLRRLRKWTRDPSEHVRRLVSEGTRPRLPWAPRLRGFQRDPAPVLALLDALKDDPSLYVRRSVANNLNDIGKDHPKQLVTIAAGWMQDASPERQWIIRHALRSSIKKGDPAALRVLGYGGAARLDLVDPMLTPMRPRMGEKVALAVTLKNPTKREQRVVADLIVHFVKANGSTSPKVFKLANLELRGGEAVALRKTVSLADLTTRKHYPGKHRVELQLNGRVQPLGAFTLTARRSAP